MMRHTRHESAPRRRGFSLLFGGLGVVIACLIGGYLVISQKNIPRERFTIAFLGDPVELASYEPATDRWSTLTFPAETMIHGAHGYGSYPVEGLWKLAATEGSPSAVLLDSFMDELGIPINRYMGSNKNVLWQKGGENPDQMISLSHLFSFVKNRQETNITLSEFLGLTRVMGSLHSELTRHVQLEDGNGLTHETAGDGSTFLVIDRSTTDRIMDDAFEDQVIRKEALRVAIYNTTGKASLGSRLGRILTTLGSHVVAIGNDDLPVRECQMVGKKDAIESETAKIIALLFRCVKKETTDDNQADLTIRIGTEYAKQFVGE